MTLKPDTPRGAGRNGRVLRWALGLSLAINLLVIGLVGGAAYRFAGGPGSEGRPPDARSYGMPYMMAMSREDRRQIGRAMRADGQGVLMSRSARRALFDGMLAALRADPFDPDAVETILLQQREASRSIQTAAETAWLAHVRAMDAAARIEYATRLEEVMKRGGRKRREKRDDRPREVR